MRSLDVMQALELLLMRYRACLPYHAWRQVCMHFMYLLDQGLPPEDGISASRHYTQHSQTGALQASSEEAVRRHVLRSESLDDKTTEYDYTTPLLHACIAAHAVVPAPAADELPEEMTWDLLPAATVAIQQVMHGVLHRLLHQPPPSVRCMNCE